MRREPSVIAAWRRALWRWHFGAGIVIAPFLAIISLTGALYTFAPQLEPWLNQDLYWNEGVPPENRQASLAAISEQISAEFPAHRIERLTLLHAARRNWEVQVLHEATGERSTVFVHPESGTMIGARANDAGLFGVILRMHRTLLAGEVGRFLTEVATSWAIVTFLTGLCMWWPKVWRKLGGVWTIRKDRGGNLNRRDRHAVLGIYLFPLAIVAMASGLLFTPVWGKLWLAGNALTGGLPDFYTNPPKSTIAPGGNVISLDQARAQASRWIDFSSNNARFIPPNQPDQSIHIHTDRNTAHFGFTSVFVDSYSGEILAHSSDKNFGIRTRLTLLFYPIHTGTLFGWPTQILAMLTALCIALLAFTGVNLWWKRGCRLTAPEAPMPKTACIVATGLAIALPLVGFSVILLAVTGKIRSTAKKCF